MKRETKSKIINILFIISLIICLYLISDTYAKYVEEVNTSYQSSAKGWKVVVNDKVIREHKDGNINKYIKYLCSMNIGPEVNLVLMTKNKN